MLIHYCLPSSNIFAICFAIFLLGTKVEGAKNPEFKRTSLMDDGPQCVMENFWQIKSLLRFDSSALYLFTCIFNFFIHIPEKMFNQITVPGPIGISETKSHSRDCKLNKHKAVDQNPKYLALQSSALTIKIRMYGAHEYYMKYQMYTKEVKWCLFKTMLILLNPYARLCSQIIQCLQRLLQKDFPFLLLNPPSC